MLKFRKRVPSTVDAPAAELLRLFVDDAGDFQVMDDTGAYVPLISSGAATWGGITGTLSSQTDLTSALGAKQDTLVSATNIKTVNGTSLLGTGDVSIGGTLADGDYGDITVSSSGTVLNLDAGVVGTTELADDAVTLAKMAEMATASLLGRSTGGTGNPEVLSASAARTLLNVADGATANTGTVTSVAISAPTGLTVGGSPITGTGTLALTLTAGYTIPTSADVGNGVTAFGWGNHASAGYQAGDAMLTDISALVDPNADRLLFWDDSAGSVTWLTLGTNLSISGTTINASGGGGGLSYWAEAQSTSAPNDTTYANSFSVVSGATDADAVIVPKGYGAFQLAVADSTATGGNKRGIRAADLQLQRGDAAQVASGDNSFAAGYANEASGNYAVAAGYVNVASGNGSVAMGRNSTASSYGAVAIGRFATADAHSTALQFGNTYGVHGAFKWSGDEIATRQCGEYTLAAQTTDATPVVATTTGTGASATNQIFLATNPTTITFRAMITARGGAASAGYILEGVIDRAGAGTTAIVGTVVKTVLAEDTTTWDVSATADAANDCLAITVTGAAATTINWAVRVSTIEFNG